MTGWGEELLEDYTGDWDRWFASLGHAVEVAKEYLELGDAVPDQR
jgi:hypothetical protein